jgi:hypothetical protein
MGNKHYSIRSLDERDDDTNELLYWSNDIGWVGAECCDSFTRSERETVNLPIGGEWVDCPHEG